MAEGLNLLLLLFREQLQSDWACVCMLGQNACPVCDTSKLAMRCRVEGAYFGTVRHT